MAGSIALIKASDGTGNASVATVQSTRSPGSTTLTVDTVDNIPATFYGTMGTPHTFTDPVTSETITVISEATAVDFKGHVSTTHLEIDAIAPGQTDLGSEVGDIIIIKPTTEWADNVADVLDEEHEDDGTHKSLTIAQPSTGQASTITPSGADANIDLKLIPKGTGRVEVNGAGAPATNTVSTSETTTSTSFTDLATSGPAATVTIGNSGIAIVILTCASSNSGTGRNYMGFAASGANTIAAADTKALYYQSFAAGSQGRQSVAILLTGLTPGSTTFTSKYRVSATTGTFFDRNIAVIAL